jgi:hypothetical protein
MSICVQTFEIILIFKAFFAEEEVVAVLTHPTMLKNLPLAAETLISFVFLHLGIEDHL